MRVFFVSTVAGGLMFLCCVYYFGQTQITLVENPPPLSTSVAHTSIFSRSNATRPAPLFAHSIIASHLNETQPLPFVGHTSLVGHLNATQQIRYMFLDNSWEQFNAGKDTVVDFAKV